MCGYRIQIEFGGPASQKGAREAFSVAGRVVFNLPATLDSAGMGFSVAGAAESKSNSDVVVEIVLCRRLFLLLWVYLPLSSRIDPPERPIFCY